jgi:hypothetical protein
MEISFGGYGQLFLDIHLFLPGTFYGTGKLGTRLGLPSCYYEVLK